MVVLKSLFFTILGPGIVAGIVPWLLLQSSGGIPGLAGYRSAQDYYKGILTAELP